MSHATRIGFARDNAERGSAEEILRHRAPQIPNRLDRCVFFALDKGLWIDPQNLAQSAQEFGCRMHADRRLKPGTFQRLAQQGTKFAIHADIDFCIGKFCDIGQMASHREDHIDLAANTLNNPLDLGQIGRCVERAVNRPDNIDARLCAFLACFHLRDALGAIFFPEPGQRAIGALPLVFINCARQEALDACAFGCRATADHFGNRACHNNARLIGIERRMGALHRLFGAVLGELFFAKTCDNDRQFMGRQSIGIMQHRRHRQILAAHRPVDNHLQALDGAKRIDCAPIATCPVMIEDQHQTGSSVLRAAAAFSSLRLKASRNSGRSRGSSCQTPVA